MSPVAEDKEPFRWSWELPPEEDPLVEAKAIIARLEARHAARMYGTSPADGPLVRFARRLERLLGLHA